MTNHITLQTIDSDGAIQEAADLAGMDTRADFFRKSVYAGGSLLAGGVLMGGMPALANAKPSAKQDIAILNFALTLEYLEAAFYKQAVASGALSGAAADLAKVISKHEDDHVKFLKKALGSKAVKFRRSTSRTSRIRRSSRTAFVPRIPASPRTWARLAGSRIPPISVLRRRS